MRPLMTFESELRRLQSDEQPKPSRTRASRSSDRPIWLRILLACVRPLKRKTRISIAQRLMRFGGRLVGAGGEIQFILDKPKPRRGRLPERTGEGWW